MAFEDPAPAPAADPAALLTGGDPAPAPAADPAPARDPAPADPAPGGADPDWFGNVSDQTAEGESASLRDWLKSAGIKDINGLAQVARDNQRALRESGRVKVPGEGASEAEIKAWREATGVPETAEGYQIGEITDANGDPVPLDGPLLQRLAAKAHEIGVPKAAYEGLVNDFIQAQLEAAAGIDAEARAEGAAWAKEQGDKAPAKLSAVNRGAEALGLSGEEVLKLRGAMGSRRALEVLSRLGEGVGEDVLMMGGGGGKFLMSGEQAQAELDAMKKDPAIAAKVSVKGTPERAKWDRLEKIAGEAANRKAAAGL